MAMLVTLKEAKEHLRQVVDVEDDDIVLKIDAASAAVLAYLKTYDFVDSSDEVDYDAVPAQVRQATLALLRIMFERDDSGETWQPGYLPPVVTSLLYPLRDPAIA